METRYRRSCRTCSRPTISDNRAVMLLARYTNVPLKLYAGFEQIRYSAPSDPQMAFTNIAGDFVCLGCQTFNNTNIVNTNFLPAVLLTGFSMSIGPASNTPSPTRWM